MKKNYVREYQKSMWSYIDGKFEKSAWLIDNMKETENEKKHHIERKNHVVKLKTIQSKRAWLVKKAGKWTEIMIKIFTIWVEFNTRKNAY